MNKYRESISAADQKLPNNNKNMTGINIFQLKINIQMGSKKLDVKNRGDPLLEQEITVISKKACNFISLSSSEGKKKEEELR